MTHVIAVVKSSMTAYPEVDALPMVRSSLTAKGRVAGTTANRNSGAC